MERSERGEEQELEEGLEEAREGETSGAIADVRADMLKTQRVDREVSDRMSLCDAEGTLLRETDK